MSAVEQHTMTREPGLAESLLVLVFLVIGIASMVYLFGDDAAYGPIQVTLMVAAFIGVLIGMKNGYHWNTIEAGIVHAVSVSTNAILILFMVGALIGAWILSGTVPALVYYGLKLLSPEVFYPVTCIICALVSISIGSSWSTMATVGVALLGVSQVLGLSTPVTVGAIVSGSYFGDKMSPLSETTNLAAAVAGSELFSHIRHMMWVSVPSIILAIILYALIGIFADYTPRPVGSLNAMLDNLKAQFSIGVHALIPLLILLVLAYKKVPVLIVIFIGALIGALFALIFQPDVIVSFVGDATSSKPIVMLKGIIMVFYGGFVSTTGNADVDKLLTKGGMWSMANTVWLIISAMMMAGVLTKVGILSRLVMAIMQFAKSTGSLIGITVLSSVSINVFAAEQYMSIILPGQMWRDEYKRRGLASVNLSRALEDAGTVTSPLVPWNTCGAYLYGVLGLASVAYIPFCFFNLANPLISTLYGYLGFTIKKEND